MADIQGYLDDIKNAVYGKEVRQSIHDSIEAINEEVNNFEKDILNDIQCERILNKDDFSLGWFSGSSSSAIITETLIDVSSVEYLYCITNYASDMAIVRYAKYDSTKTRIGISENIWVYPDKENIIPIEKDAAYIQLGLMNNAGIAIEVGSFDLDFWKPVKFALTPNKSISAKKIEDYVLDYNEYIITDFKNRYINSETGGYDTSKTNTLAQYGYSDVHNVTSLWFFHNYGKDLVVQCFWYDSGKMYVGHSDWIVCKNTKETNIPIPENAYYARFVISDRDFTTPLEYGAFYMSFRERWNNPITKWWNKDVIVVSQNGNGDYTTISEACANASDNDTIFIMPGEYVETIDCREKTLNLVGFSKETTILKNYTGLYELCPLFFGAGNISNMTIYADRNETTTDKPTAVYAVHLDYETFAGKKCEFTNCEFISKFGAAVGIGCKPGTELVFNNCKFKKLYDENVKIESGALYMHDSNSGESEDQLVRLINCDVYSERERVLVLDSLDTKNNKCYLSCSNTRFWSTVTGKAQPISTNNTNEPSEGCLVGNNIYLHEDSYGNNVDVLNA